MFIRIFSALAAAVILFAVFVSTRPDTFSYSRSIAIEAAPEAVFPYVNDLHQWENWSPWADLDPEMTRIYDGAAAGEGAIYRWSGNHEVGEGSTTIIASRPNESVRMKLEFLKPFKGTNDVEFTFRSEGEQTIVTWAMSGKNNFISKAVGVFMDCEKMIKGQFDQGLTNLKGIVEGA